MFENIHWPTVLFAALLVGIAAFLIHSQRSLKKGITALSEEELIEVMRKGQLIDIRKKEEFDKGHINGARNIPFATLTRSMSKLRGDQPIYLLCDTGKQSSRAGMLLQSKNFTKIYILKGGLASWSKPLKTKK